MISRSFAGGQNEYQQKCQRTRPRDNMTLPLVIIEVSTYLSPWQKCQRTCGRKICGAGWEAYAPESRYFAVFVVLWRGFWRFGLILSPKHNLPVDTKILLMFILTTGVSREPSPWHFVPLAFGVGNSPITAPAFLVTLGGVTVPPLAFSVIVTV